MREFEKQMKINENQLKQITIKVNYDSSFKKFAKDYTSRSFRIAVDSNICRVDLPEHRITEISIPDIKSIEPLIEQATNNIHFYAYKIPKIEKSKSGIKIEYYNDDSVYSYVVDYNMLNMDSLAEANTRSRSVQPRQIQTGKTF